MKIKLSKNKSIIAKLLLILMISNFGITYAYWASNIASNGESSAPIIEIGDWDFVDPATELAVTTFRSDHASALALTVSTVQLSDKASVEAALAAYGLLSTAAKAELADEQALLVSLLTQIIALENTVFLDFEGYVYDSGLTGTVDIDGRTWYGNAVYISNDPAYDVWMDTRSLALKMGAYFESRDLFINGIDKITIYHGALNYNNGASFQFKVEYELQSNPGVWSTVQDGGSDLLVDVISSTPLSYSEININITEALNIRFTPVISTTTDYINLDNITIYEHVVSSALEVETYQTVYANVLALTVGTVDINDKASVEAALAAYDLLSVDAKAALTVEKALLDNLLIEIELQEDILAATALVVIAESSYEQTDLDAAQILVSALPAGTAKTALQARLDAVQAVIDAVEAFITNYASTLALTVGTVELSDKAAVEAAIAAYNLLSPAAKAELAVEKALLDSLLVEINSLIPTETLVLEFRTNHAVALALTVGTVEITDRLIVEAALDAYDLLTIDAKAELTVEKALLDSLLVEIELQEIIAEATSLVVIAESSNLQTDLDAAQILVSALPAGTAKTALQDRLDDVQNIIDATTIFRSNHASALALTVSTVQLSDKASVEAALAAYGLLSEAAKAELADEQALLVSLLTQIIALENTVFLDFEGYVYDSGLTGTVDIDGRTWYGNAVYISNDPAYDVWMDTRSLALKMGAYFESRDLFINGIDKITIYHGALNYNNGASFQFKVEYELQSNPGVWSTVQDGGSDLLVDVISATPLSYSEINVNITEALNIRFTPVISTTTDYINLDNITIYEHVVSSALEVETYQTVYANVLALTVGTVDINDKASVEAALAAYDLLSVDAKAALTVEKALLDSLLIEIELQEDILAATALVVIAESSYEQTDLDAAQILVSALPAGTAKTALQARLDNVQTVINQVDTFITNHASTLALTIETVELSDKAAVEAAIAAYNVLSPAAKAELTVEKALLDSLLVEINSLVPTETLVLEFRTNHAVALALTVGTVEITDRLIVEAALDAYDLLTIDAKAELTVEKALLDSLLVEIELQEIIAAATVVVNLINALPSVGSITLSDEAQIIAARNAYNALTTAEQAYVTNEAVLIAAESDLANLQAATAAVIIAEGSNLQADVNAAQTLVSALTNGVPKSLLQSRIDAVQDIINVEQARIIIVNYFAANQVVVSRLNSNTIKQTAFLAKANEIVTGLNVTITVTNAVRVDRNNSTYTITIAKNAASISIVVGVVFRT